MKNIFILFLFFNIFSINILAQNYGLGARQAALGGCGIVLSDIWGQNQASLASIEQLSLGAYYSENLNMKDLSLKAVSILVPSKWMNFGLQFSRFGSSDLYAETKIGISFSKKLSPKLYLGIQANYFSINQINEFDNLVILFAEVGLIYKPIQNLTIGAHLFNPNGVKYALYNDFKLAQTISLGGLYQIGSSFKVMSVVAKDLKTNAVYSFGLFYQVFKFMNVSYGFKTLNSANSFGVGFKFENIQVNLAFTPYFQIAYSPHIDLNYQFRNAKL